MWHSYVKLFLLSKWIHFVISMARIDMTVWNLTCNHVPCFQKRLLPVKPLLCIKYSSLENPVGSIWKHITYHWFMQNFIMLGPAVCHPHVLEIWWNLSKFCWKIAFLGDFASLNLFKLWTFRAKMINWVMIGQ